MCVWIEGCFYQIVTAFVYVALGTAAQAGCANYADGSSVPAPIFEICYDAVCDQTALTFECANQSSFQIAFDIGWSKTCDMQSATCQVFWLDRPIDDSKLDNITCTALDAGRICNFP